MRKRPRLLRKLLHRSEVEFSYKILVHNTQIAPHFLGSRQGQTSNLPKNKAEINSNNLHGSVDAKLWLLLSKWIIEPRISNVQQLLYLSGCIRIQNEPKVKYYLRRTIVNLGNVKSIFFFVSAHRQTRRPLKMYTTMLSPLTHRSNIYAIPMWNLRWFGY